ncbi:MAG: SDR family NAD(P)-dependent oxidoreductase, partial [Planctomycetota bacterium]
NAGCGGIGPFMESDPARLDQIMNVNFLAPIKLTRFLHPQLCNSNRPVVCNIGSVLGDVGVPNKAEYCAAKAAMAKWSQSLRAELWKSGIAVVLVSPSTTKSEFFDSLVGTPEGTTSSSIAAFQQTPQTVARVTAMAIRLRVAHVQPSAGGYLLSLGQRLFPWMMNWVLRQR